MFVKVFLFITILCTLHQCNEVESFEIIKNTIKNLAHKVHNIVHPNHVHDSNCKHFHDDVVISTTTTSTTPYPTIDIRRGNLDANSETAPAKESAPIVYPDDPDAIPDFASRSIIGTACASGFRQVNGQCRAIAG